MATQDEQKFLVDEIASSVKQLYKDVEELAKKSSEFASAGEASVAQAKLLKEKNTETLKAISIITDIAEETNLLSLNASIEAARAGEQGKGFAVVAGEIQKLSGDTGDATDKINDILEALGTEARRVNRAVENLDEVSNQQNELIQKTDEQFRIIDQNISDMTGEVQRQNDYLTQINDNNTKIAGSISNTSAYTQELTASSENTMNLTKESLQGTKAMSQFLDEIMGEVQNLQAITESK